VWELKGIRRNTDKGSCTLCLGEEAVKHKLLDFLETIKWRMKYLNEKWFNEKWFNMSKDVAYRKILRRTNIR
jgi:hypothetical protein